MQQLISLNYYNDKGDTHRSGLMTKNEDLISYWQRLIPGTCHQRIIYTLVSTPEEINEYARDELRKQALQKLTPEERNVLGLD